MITKSNTARGMLQRAMRKEYPKRMAANNCLCKRQYKRYMRQLWRENKLGIFL